MKYIAIPVLAVIAIVGYTMINKDKTNEQVMTDVDKMKVTKEQGSQKEIVNDILVEFYADTDLDASFTMTQSGLQFAVLKEGTGTKNPDITNKVEVHYHGTTADGEVFDSSVLRDEPIKFDLSRLIVGWQEGIPLMTNGAKYRLIVPAVLAYGESGTHALAGKDLTFDIELISFQ